MWEAYLSKMHCTSKLSTSHTSMFSSWNTKEEVKTDPLRCTPTSIPKHSELLIIPTYVKIISLSDTLALFSVLNQTLLIKVEINRGNKPTMYISVLFFVWIHIFTYYTTEPYYFSTSFWRSINVIIYLLTSICWFHQDKVMLMPKQYFIYFCYTWFH